MKVNEIFKKNQQSPSHKYDVIAEQCSHFLEESGSLPLLKELPSKYSDFQKVKVRFRKSDDIFTETFNKAFEQNIPNIRQRAVFTNGDVSFVNESTNNEPFFVFPIDGFKFMYSKEVQNSNVDYKTVFEALFDKFEDEQKTTEIITDLLKYTYTTTNLIEGIKCGAEIALYNIPYYYAVRKSVTESYDELLTLIC